VNSLLFKRPVGRLVRAEMNVSDACCQFIEVCHCGGVREIHGVSLTRRTVRACPRLSTNGTADGVFYAVSCPQLSALSQVVAGSWKRSAHVLWTERSGGLLETAATNGGEAEATPAPNPSQS
jgi:hypothetical protein